GVQSCALPIFGSDLAWRAEFEKHPFGEVRTHTRRELVCPYDRFAIHQPEDPTVARQRDRAPPSRRGGRALPDALANRLDRGPFLAAGQSLACVENADA